jgi:hypothetical protein
MRLEVMRQLEDPTSPRASRVLQERAVRRGTAFTGIVAHTGDLLAIREPPITIDSLDRHREWAGDTGNAA